MKKTCLFTLSIILSLFITSQTFACNCVNTSTPEESLEKANNVFLAKVTNITELSLFEKIFSRDKLIEVNFDVSWVMKGEENSNIIALTQKSSSSCGYDFKKGKDYIVYTSKDEENLKISLCSRTKLVSNAEEDLNAFQNTMKYIYKEEKNEEVSGTGIIQEIILIEEEILVKEEKENIEEEVKLDNEDIEETNNNIVNKLKNNIFLLLVIFIIIIIILRKKKNTSKQEPSNNSNETDSTEKQNEREIIQEKVEIQNEQKEEELELDIKIGKEIKENSNNKKDEIKRLRI